MVSLSSYVDKYYVSPPLDISWSNFDESDLNNKKRRNLLKNIVPYVLR